MKPSRLLAPALAIAMALSLTSPALAAEGVVPGVPRAPAASFSQTAAAGEAWLVPARKAAPAYTDTEGLWCADSIDTVHRTGLLEGYTSARFAPGDALTYAQITVIAARLFSLLSGGNGTVPMIYDDAPWYQGAYDLLVSQGVLAEAGSPEALSGGALNFYDFSANDPCRRQFFAHLLCSVLDAAKVPLPQRNRVSSLPDVQPDDGKLLSLYNAGILNGADRYGGFHGTETLNRGQAAAMLARVVDPAARLTFTLPLFDVCADVLRLPTDTVLLTVDGTDLTASQVGQILARTLTWYVDPQAGLNAALEEIKLQSAYLRLAADAGVALSPAALAQLEQEADARSGYWGVSREGILWEGTALACQGALTPLFVEQYGDKLFAAALEQAARTRAAALSATLSPALQALELSAVRARALSAPVTAV